MSDDPNPIVGARVGLDLGSMRSVFRERPRAPEGRRSGEIALSRRVRTGGSVIIIVLITLMFASIALTLFIEKASNDLLVEARAINNARLRHEATSALETTLAVLQDFIEVNGALHSPVEGWSDPLEFAGYEPAEGHTVEIVFEDESGKLSLPRMEAPALVNVFKGWDMNESNAEKLADALLGWMKKDYVPTSASAPRAEDYERGDLPFLPPDRPLRSYDELAAIDYAREVFYDETGQPNDLWRRFVASFSLYDYTTPNVNAVAPDVLAAYGSTDPTQQRQLEDYLRGTGAYKNRGAGFFPDQQRIGQIAGANSAASQLGTEIRALRIHVTVREGQSDYRLSVLVASVRGGARVPKITRPPPKNPSNAPAAPAPPKNPAAGAKDGAEKKLNYPFTLLEIRENDAMPSPVTDPL